MRPIRDARPEDAADLAVVHADAQPAQHPRAAGHDAPDADALLREIGTLAAQWELPETSPAERTAIKDQLRYLHDLIAKSHKPVIVTGDFNTFWGTHEIYLFMRAAGLRSANEKNLPSFPARIPRIELDFVLVSKEIEVTNFQVPDVRFSDHRPILCDFTVNGAVASRTAVA